MFHQKERPIHLQLIPQSVLQAVVPHLIELLAELHTELIYLRRLVPVHLPYLLLLLLHHSPISLLRVAAVAALVEVVEAEEAEF
jgi:hypothetical protein